MEKNSSSSRAVEDYLAAIYKLSAVRGGTNTTALAVEMAVSPAAATNMVKKLASLRLVHYVPYRSIVLTPSGEKTALKIVRRHRLIESFLFAVLGMGWDQVHAEAHRLEHDLSDYLEDQIANYLGNPAEDPHGDPIPTKQGAVTLDTLQSLLELQPGMPAIVRRVTGLEAAHLQYLQKLGLVPKATVEVIEAAPFEGPLRVQVGLQQHSLSHQLAGHIRVSRLP
jgi:DtxR family Mn-dependent transcriptional regulator